MRLLPLLLTGCLAVAPPSQESRPDILLLMPDQMRGDCLSALGRPGLRTPQLDALVRDGTLFRRAYSTVPSCIPARYSLLTGLYPQTSGVVGFKGRRIVAPTLPRTLADAGYDTVLVGRHMHQFPASEPYGYRRRIHASTYVADDDYDRALRTAHPETGGIRPLVESLGLTFNHWQAAAWPLPLEWHPTHWIARTARQVIADSELETPLFLTASFYAPHPPLFPPERLFEHYLALELPPPVIGDWVDVDALSPDGDKNGHRIRLEGDRLRRARAGYYGLIEDVDAQIGTIVEAFRARSEAAGRPWVVVVTSDHGEMLGDHGYFRKCQPYEGSANIPLIVTGSAALGFEAGNVCKRPTCLEDVMPTLLDLAGVEPLAPVDGVSLAPVLRGDVADLRPWLHLEHATCYSREQAFHALTDGRYKYVWRPLTGKEQLFDLEGDPGERRDLAADATHADTLEEWRRRLVARLAPRPEGFSDGSSLIAGRPYRPLIAPRSRAAAQPSRDPALEHVRRLELDAERPRAVRALWAMGAAAVPALVTLLEDPRPEMVDHAALVLGSIGPAASRALEPLRACAAATDRPAAHWAAHRVATQGRTVFTDYSGGSALELLPGGGAAPVLSVLTWIYDIEPLPSGNWLVARDSFGVEEYTPNGDLVWRNPTPSWDADRLPNGNTLIADVLGARVIEVDPGGDIVWQVEGLAMPAEAQRLPDGNTLVVLATEGKVVEVDPSGATVWSVDGLPTPLDDAERLPDGTTLIGGNGDGLVCVVDRDGQRRWAVEGLPRPNDVDLLPDGGLLWAGYDGIFQRSPDGVQTCLFELRVAGEVCRF